MVDPDFYLDDSLLYLSHLPMLWMMIQFRAVVCVCENTHVSVLLNGCVHLRLRVMHLDSSCSPAKWR